MALPAAAGTVAPVQHQLDGLTEAADAAASACGGWRERTVRIAGEPFILRFAGTHLLDALFPSFAHLAAGGAAAGAASVKVFESTVSGVARPHLPWSEIPDAPGEPIVRLDEGDHQGVADSRSTIVAMADLTRRRAVMHVPDVAGVASAEMGARLRPPLLLLLGALGPLPLHAAAVGAGERGALLAGMSGAGKSTLSVACALTGMSFCGDDYVVLEDSKGAPIVHALNSTVRLSLRSAGLLGLELPAAAFAPEVQEGDFADPKGQFDIDELAPGAMRSRLRLRAVVVPRRDGVAGKARPIGGAAALRALAPSTVLQSPGRRPYAMRTLGSLVRALPCFELATGGDPRAAATALSDLLEGLD